MDSTTEWHMKRASEEFRRRNPVGALGGTRLVGSPVCPGVAHRRGTACPGKAPPLRDETVSRIPVSFSFTLVELLVVVAIIGVLAGFLLPALSAATAATKRLVCMSNMRQLNVATANYAVDFAHYLPQPSHDSDIPDKNARGAALWFNALDHYLQLKSLPYAGGDTANRNYASFKQCSLWMNFPDRVVSGSFNARMGSRTIKMNGFLGDIYNDLPNNPSKFKFFRMSDIRHPSETVLFFDGRAWDTRNASDKFDSGGSSFFHGAEIYVGLRHPNDSANVAFIDGHVENVSQAIRVDTSYPGWFRANQGGGQIFNWFRLGRGGVYDN